jgi:hypothetical protein
MNAISKTHKLYRAALFTTLGVAWLGASMAVADDESGRSDASRKRGCGRCRSGSRPDRKQNRQHRGHPRRRTCQIARVSDGRARPQTPWTSLRDLCDECMRVL